MLLHGEAWQHRLAEIVRSTVKAVGKGQAVLLINPTWAMSYGDLCTEGSHFALSGSRCARGPTCPDDRCSTSVGYLKEYSLVCQPEYGYIFVLSFEAVLFSSVFDLRCGKVTWEKNHVVATYS